MNYTFSIAKINICYYLVVWTYPSWTMLIDTIEKKTDRTRKMLDGVTERVLKDDGRGFGFFSLDDTFQPCCVCYMMGTFENWL